MAILDKFLGHSERVPAYFENQWKELKSYWLSHCETTKTEHLFLSVQMLMWLGRVEFARARRNDKIREYLSSALDYLRRVSYLDRVVEQDILAHIQYLDYKDEAEMKPILLPFRCLNGVREGQENGLTPLKRVRAKAKVDLFETNSEELEKLISKTVLVATAQNPQPSGLRSVRSRVKSEAFASPMIFKNERPTRRVGNKIPKPDTATEKELKASKDTPSRGAVRQSRQKK